DRELDLAADDPGQEEALELLVAVADQRLADDPDALAGLRRAVARERLGQEEVVDPGPLGSAVLARPRHAQPAPSGQVRHEGALPRGVHGLGELLGMSIHHLGRAVLRQEPLQGGLEVALGRGELEVHAGSVGARRYSRERESVRKAVVSPRWTRSRV